MGSKLALEKIQEGVTVFFLAAGPVLGGLIALAWIVSLAMGLFSALFR
jgi:hypothetical protein